MTSQEWEENHEQQRLDKEEADWSNQISSLATTPSGNITLIGTAQVIETVSEELKNANMRVFSGEVRTDRSTPLSPYSYINVYAEYIVGNEAAAQEIANTYGASLNHEITGWNQNNTELLKAISINIRIS